MHPGVPVFVNEAGASEANLLAVFAILVLAFSDRVLLQLLAFHAQRAYPPGFSCGLKPR